VNITKLAQIFGKRWRNWKSANQKVIKKYEVLEGKPIIREDYSSHYKQTYIPLTLALRVLINYDEAFSWDLFKKHQQLLQNNQEIEFLKKTHAKEVELLEAENAKLRNKLESKHQEAFRSEK
jgi:hypothetical protein